MTPPSKIAWCRKAAPNMADLEIIVCPDCAGEHLYDPEGPCQDFGLYEAPPELIVELEKLAAIAAPWLIIDGCGMVHSRHGDLPDAHTKLLETVQNDPFARLVNERFGAAKSARWRAGAYLQPDPEA